MLYANIDANKYFLIMVSEYTNPKHSFIKDGLNLWRKLATGFRVANNSAVYCLDINKREIALRASCNNPIFTVGSKTPLGKSDLVVRVTTAAV